MSQLLLAFFGSEYRQANEAYKTLRQMSKSNQIEGILSAVIVVKNPDGRFSLSKSTGWHTGETGSWGSFWGLVMGITFSLSTWGWALGVVADSSVGWYEKAKVLIDHDFLSTIGRVFGPGSCGIFLLAKSGHMEMIALELEQQGAVVFQDEQELDDEVVDALKGPVPTQKRWLHDAH